VSSAGNPETGRQTPRRRGPSAAILAVLGVALVISGLFAYLAWHRNHQQNQPSEIRATGIPASVPTSLANLMALSPVPTRPAPDFTLIDQNGHSLSLASLRGHAVVLEFLDSHCIDICPLVSQEFVDAYRDLGRSASRVTFVGVNVNPYHLGVSDVAAFSREQRLFTIPSWHYFTGTLDSLRTVWHDYRVEVDAPSPNADVIHTSIIEFIDPQGRQRYIAAPMADHTASGSAYLPAAQITSWGRGIALVARQLSR
jgi:cytochrome oxidase Cu insertion factor (SCO1/SenC/PrrC family)